MGGWVVDTVAAAPQQGGAIVVIDEDSYAASIRMYNQSADPSRYRVKVTRADADSSETNPLYDRLCELVNPERPPWSEFSAMVSEAVKVRQDNLRRIIRDERNSWTRWPPNDCNVQILVPHAGDAVPEGAKRQITSPYDCLESRRDADVRERLTEEPFAMKGKSG